MSLITFQKFLLLESNKKNLNSFNSLYIISKYLDLYDYFPITIGGLFDIESFVSEIYIYKNNIWQKVDSNNSWNLNSPVTCRIDNDKILIIGGSKTIYDTSNECYIYNIKKNNKKHDIRKKIKSLNFSRRSHNAIIHSTGNVFVFGGFVGVPRLFINTIEMYMGNIYSSDNKWIVLKTRLSENKAGCSIVELLTGEILIMGGFNGDISLNTCELFNPITNSIKFVAPLNYERECASACLLPNGHVLISGGRDLSSCEEYNPKTNKWTIIESMNDKRSNHCSILLDNRLVMVMGGVLDTHLNNVTSSCEIYDYITQIWSKGPDMMSKMYNFSCC